jgi:hypothetical protein
VLAFSPELSAKSLINNHHPAAWDDWGTTQRIDLRRAPARFSTASCSSQPRWAACLPRPSSGSGRAHRPFADPVLFLPIELLLPLRVLVTHGGGRVRAKTATRTFAIVFIVLAAMCIGQYFTLAEGWTDLRYTYQSFLLLIGFGIILAHLAWESLKLAPFTKSFVPQQGCVRTDTSAEDGVRFGQGLSRSSCDFLYGFSRSASGDGRGLARGV